MKPLPEHELLSAYLDGELTVAEQARVEQVLADSPAALELLDELRAVSMAVQRLPELRVGENLSDRVLREAERVILAGPGEVEEAAAGDGLRPSDAPRWREVVRRVAVSRGAAWSIAALAIALLIMLSSPPEPERGRDVVRAPEAAPRRPAPPAEPELPSAAEMWAPDAPRDESMVAGERPADPEPEAAGSPQRNDVADMEVAPLAAGDAPGRQEAPPPAPAPSVSGERAPAGPELPAPRVAPATPVEPLEEATETERQLVAPAQPAPERLKTDRGAPLSGQLAGAKAGTPADAPVMIVQVDITPEAARQGAFDQVLAGQQIAARDGWTDAQIAGQPARLQAARRRGDEPPRRAESRVAELDAWEEASGGAFDVVLVEATSDQVAAALDQVAQLPDQFLAVSVKPAPGVASQQKLMRFNRHAPEPEEKGMDDQLRLPAPKDAAAMPAAEPVPETDGAVAEMDEMLETPSDPRERRAPARDLALPSAHGGPPVGGRTPAMLRNGGAGYGGAAGLDFQAPPSEAQPDADGHAPETPERHRVLFILRVVP